jgi:hypothetical protein
MKEEAGEYRQYNGKEEVVIVIVIVIAVVIEKSRGEDRKEREKIGKRRDERGDVGRGIECK